MCTPKSTAVLCESGRYLIPEVRELLVFAFNLADTLAWVALAGIAVLFGTALAARAARAVYVRVR